MPTLRDELNTSEPKSKNRNKNSKWPGIVEPAPKLGALKILYGDISNDRELARKIVDNDPQPANGDNLEDQVVALIKRQWIAHKPTEIGQRRKSSVARKAYSLKYSLRVVAKINEKIKEEAPEHQKVMTKSVWINGTYADFCNAFRQRCWTNMASRNLSMVRTPNLIIIAPSKMTGFR